MPTIKLYSVQEARKKAAEFTAAAKNYEKQRQRFSAVLCSRYACLENAIADAIESSEEVRKAWKALQAPL